MTIPPWLPPVERFWAKVDKNGPIPTHCHELGHCWVWTGGKTSKHYGIIREGHAGPRHLAHRVSWRLSVGPIDDGTFVLHRCDNPPCVRPSHLFLGSHDDNMADCAAKGRTKKQRGGRHALTKLTEANVIEMRTAYAGGESVGSIARRHSLAKSTASYIVHGRTWAHVPMPAANDSDRRSA